MRNTAPTRPAKRRQRFANNPAWTPAEDITLRIFFTTEERATVLGHLPGRTWYAIQERARKLGHPRRRVTIWNPAQIAALLTHYPAQGAAYVAALVGKSPLTVTKKASVLGIERVFTPKPAPKPRAAAAPARPVPQAAKPAPRPVPVAAPAPAPRAAPAPPKRAVVSLPNHTAQKAKARAAAAARTKPAVTAEDIRKLGANDPARRAYALGGVAGWVAYQQQRGGQAV